MRRFANMMLVAWTATDLIGAVGCDAPISDPPSITLAEAIAVAEQEFPEGVAVEAEFEGEEVDDDDADEDDDGDEESGLFEVELLVGEEVAEVAVAAHGELLETSTSREDLDRARAAADALDSSVVTLREGVQTVERANVGTVVFAAAEPKGTIEVVAIDAGTPMELIVHMDTGELGR